MPAAKTAALANVVATHGDGILCATQSQNVVLRWVAESELPALREKLDTLGLATPDAPVLRNLVACAGASTCRLGICLSRGLAKAIRQELTGSQLKLESLGDLTIHISGCPNSCGRHPVGNIGFSGAARRVDGRLIPYYAVQLGGRVTEGGRDSEPTSERSRHGMLPRLSAISWPRGNNLLNRPISTASWTMTARRLHRS